MLRKVRCKSRRYRTKMPMKTQWQDMRRSDTKVGALYGLPLVRCLRPQFGRRARRSVIG